MDIRLRLNRTHPGTPGCMRHPRWGACNSEIIINPSLTNFTSSNPYAPPMEVKKSEKGRFRVDRFLQGGLGERYTSKITGRIMGLLPVSLSI